MTYSPINYGIELIKVKKKVLTFTEQNVFQKNIPNIRIHLRQGWSEKKRESPVGEKQP